MELWHTAPSVDIGHSTDNDPNAPHGRSEPNSQAVALRGSRRCRHPGSGRRGLPYATAAWWLPLL